MVKVFVFVPKANVDQLIEAMAATGAGVIGNYSHNAFIVEGMGNWRSEEGAHPTIGEVGKMSREPEAQVQMICPEDKLTDVIAAIKKVHPYETPGIDVYKLESLA